MTSWWPQEYDLKVWLRSVLRVEKNDGDIFWDGLQAVNIPFNPWPLTSAYISKLRSNVRTDTTMFFFVVENPCGWFLLCVVSQLNFVTFDPDLLGNWTVKLAESWLLGRAHHGLSCNGSSNFFKRLEIPEIEVRSPRGQNDLLVTSKNRPKNLVSWGFRGREKLWWHWFGRNLTSRHCFGDLTFDLCVH